MSQPGDELLTIGAFSKRSRLSLKALRVYDEMGLLKPAYVDPRTAYRYYRDDQMEIARLIGLLRRLEMPLANIAEVLELEGSVAAKSIASYWQGVEADMRTKRKLVRYLQGYLTSKGESMFAIETREVGPQTVATIERRVVVRDLTGFIDEAMGALHDLVAANGAQPDIPFVIYHGNVNTDADGPVEVCLPFNGQVKPSGEARIRSEPAHKEAFTRITKGQVAFPGILDAYKAVEKWVQDQKLDLSGSPREVYFADWSVIGPDDPGCDIAFPVKA